MRKLMLGALSIALAGSLQPTSAAAEVIDGPAIEWRHSVWGKRRAYTEGMEKIAALLKERTGGKFTIKIGYGARLGMSGETADAP